jgi:gamma-glutamyl hercynylcysteine S-oxide synthase
MHGKQSSQSSLQGLVESSVLWRKAHAQQLAVGLQSLRAKTLSVFDAYVAAGKLHVPYAVELNPPLWELGHLAWFQEHWVGRNQQRHLGIYCEPKHARLPSVLETADSLYDSGNVPHDTRWHLALLEPDACKAYLAKTLEQTLNLLSKSEESDDALYFYCLVLFHEAMHLEAALYMAQALGIEVTLNKLFLNNAINNIATEAINTPYKRQLTLEKQSFLLGSTASGFVFDNELGAHSTEVAEFEIDSRCINWGEYLSFVEATSRNVPRYVRKSGLGYEHQKFGVWKAIDLEEAAVHINLDDAQSYCAWAERRLPSETEWELAAISFNTTSKPDPFQWGEVWEWTSSTFAPYPGFVAHPYKDYSEPWFGSRQVLRGACVATQPMIKNAKYRNYFTPDRTDIYAGFRTCRV